MFADDTAYVLLSQDDIQNACPTIFKHIDDLDFSCMSEFSMKTHSNNKTQSKTEAAMFIPVCPMTPAEIDGITADIIFGDSNQYYIPFTTKFTYLHL
jgi:hypothetical protein